MSVRQGHSKPAELLTPDLLRLWAAAAARGLADHAQEINDLNVFPVPDGDTGTNSSLTFRAGQAAVASLPDDADAMTIARTLGQAAALGARGNSGVILSQMLRGILDAAVDPERAIDGRAVAAIVTAAADAGREAVGDPRDGTMLTVASDAAAAAREAARADGDLAAVCTAAADAARVSLTDTPNHLEVLAQAGVVDAGGRAVVVVLDALAEVVTGEARPQWAAPALTATCDVAHLRASYSGPAYEVMYVLQAPAVAIADVQSQLVNLGDSLAVVGGDGSWSVHVHVDDVSAAIEIGRAAGLVDHIRVSYLRDTSAAGTYLPAVVGADGDVADILAGAGFAVVPHSSLREAASFLRHACAVAGNSSVLLLCTGVLATTSAQSWQEAVGPDLTIAIVACHHAPQVLAAAAVHDSAQPLSASLALALEAIAGVQCAEVHHVSGVPRWSAGSWESTASVDISRAVSDALGTLVDDNTELISVLRDPSCPLSTDELTALVSNSDLGSSEFTVFTCSLMNALVAIGVE